MVQFHNVRKCFNSAHFISRTLWDAGGTVAVHVSLTTVIRVRFQLRAVIWLKLPWSHVRRVLSSLSLQSIAGFLRVLRFPPVVTLGPWPLTGPPGRTAYVADRVIQYKQRNFNFGLAQTFGKWFWATDTLRRCRHLRFELSDTAIVAQLADHCIRLAGSRLALAEGLTVALSQQVLVSVNTKYSSNIHICNRRSQSKFRYLFG